MITGEIWRRSPGRVEGLLGRRVDHSIRGRDDLRLAAANEDGVRWRGCERVVKVSVRKNNLEKHFVRKRKTKSFFFLSHSLLLCLLLIPRWLLAEQVVADDDEQKVERNADGHQAAHHDPVLGLGDFIDFVQEMRVAATSDG